MERDSLPAFDIVVAVDAAGGMGHQDGLPGPRLRTDLAHLRDLTRTAPEGQRNAVIMGRKTWTSKEVAGRPLPRRLNIVISRSPLSAAALATGARHAASLDAALATAQRAHAHAVFVVGGAEIYRQALAHPRLRWVYLTRIAATFATDTVFPEIPDHVVADGWSGARDVDEDGFRYRIERLTSMIQEPSSRGTP